MQSLNKAMLIGNAGKDPELRYTTSGKAVCNMSIATNSKWKDSDGNLKEATEWHNLVLWGKSAEIFAQYVTKGKKVYVEGRLQTRSWDDANTGVKKYITEIVVEHFMLLGSLPQADGDTGREDNAPAEPDEPTPTPPAKNASKPATKGGNHDDDPLPF